MEILGRRIPGLQNAITSGLESVTAGIAESTKASGAAALSVAQDSFSFEQTGTSNTANLPAVSEAAEYPAPDQYFRQFPDTASDSPVSSLAISKTLSDPNFNAPKSLQTFSVGPLGKMVFGDDMTYDAAERFGREKADGTGSDRKTEEWLRPEESLMDKLAGDKQRAGEAMMWKPSPGEALMWKPTPGEALMWKPTPGVADAVSNRSIIVVGGKNDIASDRSIIVVGGKTDSASDRSIIVVGGKTSDTYLQTIDDSMNQLRENPTEQITELFRNQFGAVQGLLNTVNQAVQLQQSFASNLFKRNFRI
jgi:hypothetical protein